MDPNNHKTDQIKHSSCTEPKTVATDKCQNDFQRSNILGAQAQV